MACLGAIASVVYALLVCWWGAGAPVCYVHIKCGSCGFRMASIGDWKWHWVNYWACDFGRAFFIVKRDIQQKKDWIYAL